MKAWIMLMLALSLPVAALAEEAKEGEAPKVSYISLSPPFVGNYGLDGTPKLTIFSAAEGAPGVCKTSTVCCT